MELDLDKIEESQRIFNQKYGVDYNLSEFDGQMRALSENFVGNRIPQNDWNTHYRSDFMKLMRRAFEIFVDFKINDFDPRRMINDFEEMIIQPYREECRSKGAVAPSKDAGWSNKDFYRRVQREFQNVPERKADYSKERYMDGTLRVRDVRAFRNRINNEADFFSKNTLSTLISYKEALDHAVSKRSIWFYIRHPFKSRAEINELAEVKSCIAEKIGVDVELIEGAQDYIDARAVLEDNTISGLKENISEVLSKDAQSPEKTRVFIHNLESDTSRNLGNSTQAPIKETELNKGINDFLV